MGHAFARQSPLMAQAFEQGKSRLRKMLHEQFAVDGVHLEHSPSYFLMVYESFLKAIDIHFMDEPETVAFMETIERALSWLVRPNNRLANFGDSNDQSSLTGKYSSNEGWLTEEIRYVASAGELGCSPIAKYAAFQQGGYFVIRVPSQDNPLDLIQSSYLAQITGFHSRVHKHADDLSFIWMERGHDILIDSGRYGYIGRTEEGSDDWQDGHWYSDKNRIYCESTRAHNTLEFDGRNYPRKGVRPYGSALTRWLEDPSGIIAVETACRHFRTIRRWRVLLMMPGEWLIVIDGYRDMTGAHHDVSQWFHFSPWLDLQAENMGFITHLTGVVTPLYLMPLLDGMDASRVYKGDTEPRMQGWFSPAERMLVPAPASCFMRKNESIGVFAAILTFSANLTVHREWSAFNVTGNQGRLRWQDEKGVHTVRLDRREGNALQMSYDCQESMDTGVK